MEVCTEHVKMHLIIWNMDNKTSKHNLDSKMIIVDLKTIHQCIFPSLPTHRYDFKK